MEVEVVMCYGPRFQQPEEWSRVLCKDVFTAVE